jgi:hypothetical protein
LKVKIMEQAFFEGVGVGVKERALDRINTAQDKKNGRMIRLVCCQLSRIYMEQVDISVENQNQCHLSRKHWQNQGGSVSAMTTKKE